MPPLTTSEPSPTPTPPPAPPPPPPPASPPASPAAAGASAAAALPLSAHGSDSASTRLVPSAQKAPAVSPRSERCSECVRRVWSEYTSSSESAPAPRQKTKK
eukprot:1480774-Pleurochrysis_carterae.AAC.2